MKERRKLGSSNLEIAPLVLGGNVFGWTIDESQSFKILDGFVDAGFNMIDTADSYSRWVPGNQGGESETIIGNWMKKNKKRYDVLVATKLGGDMGNGKKGLKREYIKQAAEASLKRLQTDHIDLYQVHHDDPETPVEETIEALNKLITEGKVRFIGASNVSSERIREANQFAKDNNFQSYISLQPLYNLYSRQKFEKEYLSLTEEEDLGVIPYYSLASGFLTGKYRSEKDFSKSVRGKKMSKYLDERGKKILAAMDKISAEKKAALAEIAISWLLHKPYITAPIASATNKDQLSQLIGGAQMQLTEEEMKLLDNASAY